jgi:hypothetical protein
MNNTCGGQDGGDDGSWSFYVARRLTQKNPALILSQKLIRHVKISCGLKYRYGGIERETCGNMFVASSSSSPDVSYLSVMVLCKYMGMMVNRVFCFLSEENHMLVAAFTVAMFARLGFSSCVCF